MKYKILVYLMIIILILSGCSNNYNNKKSVNSESHLKESTSQLDDAPTEEEMIELTLNYVPNLKEMYDKLYSHYLSLYDEYKNQKASYDVNSWTVFLNSWNNTLKKYRAELDSYKVTGHVYDLFYVKQQLSSTGTNMAVVWIYYSNLLEDRSDKKAYDDLIYFTESIENSFKECKTYLDKY